VAAAGVDDDGVGVAAGGAAGVAGAEADVLAAGNGEGAAELGAEADAGVAVMAMSLEIAECQLERRARWPRSLRSMRRPMRDESINVSYVPSSLMPLRLLRRHERQRQGAVVT